MSPGQGVMFVGPDMAIQGSIRNCRVLEIAGHVEGEIAVQSLIIHEGGGFYGKIRAEQAEVHGTLTGQAQIKNLIKIGRSGSVSGDVKYGQLAMELGAELSADVRNVPPSLFGDLDLLVARGQAVQITTVDLTAIDPDGSAASLIYAVTRPSNGYVELAETPGKPIETFTQADLEAGRVSFRHDGNGSGQASFDVVVMDHAGATSGQAKTVHVTVR